MSYHSYYNISIRNYNEIPIERQREASFYLVEKFGWDEEYKETISKEEFDPFFWLCEEIKWYDWRADMIDVSARFPEIEFVLYGEGVDREDLWRAFFKDGKCIVQTIHFYWDPEPTF